MKWLALALINASIVVLSMRVCATPTPVYQISEDGYTWLQFLLTHDIYRYSADTSLTNLVVLDNKGNKLPYRIMFPSVEETKPVTTKIPLRFFPVVTGTSLHNIRELDSASIRIYNNEVSVELKHTTNNSTDAAVDFYVADISDIKANSQHLELDWDADDASQYLEVQISASRDLQHWDFISDHTLVKLQKDGEWLIRNRIPLNLPTTDYGYLRLKFGRGGEHPGLRNIHIETYEKQIKKVTREKWELTGLVANDQQSALRASISKSMPVAAWEYERKEWAPVTRVAVNLGDKHYGDSIHIYSRRNPKQPWQLLHQGVWFNVQVGSAWQGSDPVSIYSNADPHWRIELNEAVRELHNPTLVFEQQQQLLQFVANNAAPYRVAFEKGEATNYRHIYEQIFSQLVGDKKQQWVTVTPLTLNSDANGIAAEASPFDWKTWLFWGALLIGVATLIGLTIRLFKQMKPL